jgi:uncharacterized membrane protein YqhA
VQPLRRTPRRRRRAAFLLGALNAFAVTGKAWNEALAHGEFAPTDLLIEILGVIDVMLRAVVFYIIGVGLYSLFIAPLNLTAALGVDSLIDLETKVISIIIVILAVSFLEHFVRWEKPGETLNFAAALAIVVAALVVFQWNNQRVKEFEKTHRPDVQARAQSEMFQGKHEEREIRPGETREPATSAFSRSPRQGSSSRSAFSSASPPRPQPRPASRADQGASSVPGRVHAPPSRHAIPCSQPAQAASATAKARARTGRLLFDHTESTFAAMMKSLRWRPRILCVQRVIVTRPHSVNMAG